MFDVERITSARLEVKAAEAPRDDRPQSDGAKLPPRYRPRRSTSDRLRDALLALGANAGELARHDEKPWSSITFTGTRHEIALTFEGRAAVDAGESFIAQLPDHEFRIPGQLVADASVREVDHRFGQDEQLTVTCVLLLLEDV